MDIVAVINYKGGVGKTTVTSNLAAGLAWSGKKVLLIDTDAQASLTFSFIKPDEWDQKYKDDKTIKSWFDAIGESKEPPPLKDFIITPKNVNQHKSIMRANGRIDLICSHLGLLNVDLVLATLLGGANMEQTKRRYIQVHGKLRAAIETLANESDYDIVLIDCPPNFNIVTKNAIVAAEKILIPAKPDYLSTLGIDYLERNVQLLVKEFNEFASFGTDEVIEKIQPEIMGVIFTMIQIQSNAIISAQKQFVAQTRRLGLNVFKSYIRDNKTLFSVAPQTMIPVVLHHHSALVHIIDEIRKFVKEFEEKLSNGSSAT
ncbi:AAA family ATPase [Conchiformibius steedae DSM 2580]|uniref:AAA family ATPase n=1 Tax=Conchiformibius steedae DSM 2580 TaxID=1121352 RepID=A0AAE9L012_9NEIS|nr:AAA family ATPase [Conchiformibius steedae]QMT33270.1 AAA family ATPase [Conchiformibius steedae]URD67911.1 AAA family ATPase [Conchiformibius steedae DSM 2580]